MKKKVQKKEKLQNKKGYEYNGISTSGSKCSDSNGSSTNSSNIVWQWW